MIFIDDVGVAELKRVANYLRRHKATFPYGTADYHPYVADGRILHFWLHDEEQGVGSNAWQEAIRINLPSEAGGNIEPYLCLVM